jgi:pSer/pThr/pTyr-binding forkhead associated (FHA) protein
VVVPGKEVRETGADAATKGDEPKSVVTHPEAAPEKRAVPADDRGEARVPMDGEACGVLRIVSEEHFGREFHITGEVLRIGKEVSADISLPDDTFTSHAHARLLVRGADVEIEDLGSRNGTFIQVRDRECLKNGDRLLIGATVLEYRAARCRME